jgi:hypothetical protein
MNITKKKYLSRLIVSKVASVADATEWLSMKYKDKKQDITPLRHTMSTLLMIKNLIPWLTQNNLKIRILPKVNRQKSYFERRACLFLDDFSSDSFSDAAMAPYITRELKYGKFASSVLAISWGKGDPHNDPITLVFIDEAGRMREHTKIDNLYDADDIDEFKDLLKWRKPDVAVVGGFTVATLKLMNQVKELFRDSSSSDQGWGASNEQAFDIQAIYLHDDVARIYHHSKRTAEEFSALPPNAKYCVGLARYVQSPLDEFAALGPDITAISLDEDNQHLVYIYLLLFIYFMKLLYRSPKTNCLLHSRKFLLISPMKWAWISTALWQIHIINISSLLSVVWVLEKHKS